MHICKIWCIVCENSLRCEKIGKEGCACAYPQCIWENMERDFISGKYAAVIKRIGRNLSEYDEGTSRSGISESLAAKLFPWGKNVGNK